MILAAIGAAASVAAADVPDRDDADPQSAAFLCPNPPVENLLRLMPKAPPLPSPTGRVVRVSDVNSLHTAARQSPPGTTVLLADGLYPLADPVVVRTNGIVIRGASGDRGKVILDRGGQGQSVITVAGADDVTIADLTVRNCSGMGIEVKGELHTQRTRIYNVVLHNIWTRGVKGMKPGGTGAQGEAPEADFERNRLRDGEIRYCLFVNDKRKDVTDWADGDYIGGIDMMGLSRWTIADNVFVGIRGRHGIGRGAIFVWVWSEDVVVERNLIVNCDRGICFGNPSGDACHMTRGIIRNNFIVAGVNSAIEVVRTRDTLVAHNTVWGCRPEYPYTVHVFQGAAGVRCINNLVHGQVRLAPETEVRHNLTGACDGYCVDPANGDLHLAPRAADALGKGLFLRDVPADFDGQPRKAVPDIGADED